MPAPTDTAAIRHHGPGVRRSEPHALHPPRRPSSHRRGLRLGLAITSALTSALTSTFTAADPPPSTASPIRWPDAADIERARRERPLPSAAQLATQPMRQLPVPPDPVTARDPDPRTGSAPMPIDLEALARAGQALTSSKPIPNGSPTSAPTLQVFISLTMPSASLRRLVDQARRSGATLVLRGLQNQSMRQTLTAVSGLIGTQAVGWVIDPEAFQRHGVELVPTFVVTAAAEPAWAPSPGKPRSIEPNPRSDAADRNDVAPICPTPDTPSCNPNRVTGQATWRIAGDVSVDHALQSLLRAQPDAAPAIQPFLQRLQVSKRAR